MDPQTKSMAEILENEHFFKTSWPQVEDNSSPVPMRARPAWKDAKIHNMQYDNGLTVTHVNQTEDLMRLKNLEDDIDKMQSSEEWLYNQGIASMKLTIQDLLNMGHIVMRPTINGSKHLEFSDHTVNEFESKLHKAIEMYHKRIRWLLEGSRKCLVDEQLCYKKQLCFLSFGTDVQSLWDSETDVNIRTLHEARQWIQDLNPQGGCNLLRALRRALHVQEIDTLVIVVTSCPDQTEEVLSDYIQQCIIGRTIQIQIVAFDSIGQNALRKLAEEVGGWFHCYSSWKEHDIYSSTDIQLLLKEIQVAKDVLSKINEMHQGMLGDSLISIMQEISAEVEKIPPSAYLPKPLNHNGPLHIEIPVFSPKTSAEWLKNNGLKAKKLSLYQILAPNAYSLVEEFVPILQKTVSSTLHERAMMQFEWHDGSIKNIHVDPPMLYEYQKQLGKIAKTYEKRIDWLTRGSRRLWGTVCEKRVVLLVDISLSNSMHIIHIQHSLRLLLEDQMSNKDLFNIIVWVLSLQCEGGRNVLGAIRRAIENYFIDKENQESQGIYLFASGIPDQDLHVVSAYLCEAVSGSDLQLHACLFNVGDGEINAEDTTAKSTSCILKDLAYITNGRFHWFDDKGLIESDDINSVISEMEKAVDYSRKCAFLVNSLKQRYGNKEGIITNPTEESIKPLRKEKYQLRKLPPPRPTALTLARMGSKEEQESKKDLKTLMWRPNSAKADIPPAQPMNNWHLTATGKKVNGKKQFKTSYDAFYTEKGKNVGVVYKEYPPTKTVRKSVPFIVLPKEEEFCSTKAWLKKYSLKKLKLDLAKLIFGPDCTHQKKMVPTLQKKVSAKYCTIFPSVEVNGVVRHIQFQPKELDEYMEQLEKLLRRYLQRMQWLLSGSRRVIGTVLENSVCFLIDTSSSMAQFYPEVQKALMSALWEQLRERNVR
ncbi:hypothetical protein GDO86_017399 [Hymenochirus boettgeri]|uniref:VWFA domain-containing protein n=1 Tax=Hymenochirus boettgeri TaxID=247094 RepID=A0A8T2IJY6_9PIPI|nr:hypothetical protein GDO86_017399 [Hymenochirus boettgeri]